MGLSRLPRLGSISVHSRIEDKIVAELNGSEVFDCMPIAVTELAHFLVISLLLNLSNVA